jgi:hypothetical protein
MIHIAVRLRLLAIACGLLAIWLGWKLANEEFVLPVLVGVLAIGGIAITWSRASVGALALGVALFGYIVGNRGFAQIMPAPWLPILPAEIVLLVAGSWLLVQCAFTRRLPWRNDGLNWAILLWCGVGTARVIFDVPQFGLLAVRDYAMIYYAAFFFLAQHLAADERSQRLLLNVLLVASVVQPVAAVLVEQFPEFFLGRFVIRGVPVIYFKGDLALTFTAASAFILAFLARPAHRWWAWPLATAELFYVIGNANRASMLAATAGLLWLLLSRGRRFAVVQFCVIGLGFLLLTGAALLTDNNWVQRKFEGVTERLASIGDVFGARNYVSEESFMKGDNNRFRTVWWATVVDETLTENALFGLGFGRDLARTFVREYNPEGAEEFTARSPHSIAVSAFGRMGLLGVCVFVLICGVLVRRTWREMRDHLTDPGTLGLWAAAWVVLISACFGVVLEGPMGAVFFWTVLGLVSARAALVREVPPGESKAPHSQSDSALHEPAAQP